MNATATISNEVRTTPAQSLSSFTSSDPIMNATEFICALYRDVQSSKYSGSWRNPLELARDFVEAVQKLAAAPSKFVRNEVTSHSYLGGANSGNVPKAHTLVPVFSSLKFTVGQLELIGAAALKATQDPDLVEAVATCGIVTNHYQFRSLAALARGFFELNCCVHHEIRKESTAMREDGCVLPKLEQLG